MKLLIVSVIVVLLAGCEDQYYQPIEPRASTHLRGRASTIPPSGIPQWPMYHHDARHTGNVNTPVFDVAGPTRDSVAIAWRTPIDMDLMGSPAIGIDGTIYFVTQADLSPTSSVYALNQDGTIKWRYNPIGFSGSTPAIGDDGSIFVLAGDGLYAFSPSGVPKWRDPELGYATSSPAIGRDGTVYYVTPYAGQDYLKAVDPSNGVLKWEVKGGDDINSPSIGADGTIYYSNHGTITAVSPTGEVKWKYRDANYTSESVYAIELGYDGTLYFVGVPPGPSPYLYAIDTQGHLKWKYHIGGDGSDPCIDRENNIIAVSGGVISTMTCLGSNGQPIWSAVLPTPNAILNVPLTMDNSGNVYIGVTDCPVASLLAYNKTNLLWQFGANYPDNGVKMVASPAIFNWSIYFAWAYGLPYFYCLH